MSKPISITVFGENVHEQTNKTVADIYPKGMHTTIADALNQDPGLKAGTVTLQQPEHGLTEAVLKNTDVLFWWGHAAHHKVEDAVVERIANRVLNGMGLVVLHSGHHAKIFKKLMGHNCDLSWREAGEKERIWITNPTHPIVADLGVTHFDIEHEEMYGEPFGIPEPMETIMLSWFQGGEVFRSGATWRRGAGKIFYFRPGHETYPTYHLPMVQKILRNAAKWAKPEGAFQWGCPNVPVEKSLEPLKAWGGSVH
jgi:trehalose utilization protein